MANSAIVVEKVSAYLGCVDQRSGRVDVDVPLQLHDIRIRVFDGFKKQPREEPVVLSVVQRNGKSWR